MYRARAAMGPGARISLSLVGVDFTRDMLQNFVEISCSDDWGGASNVVAVTRVRPRDEEDGEVEQSANSEDFVPSDTQTGAYSWLTYTGYFPATDPNGFASQTLPAGVVAVPVSSGAASVMGLRNDSGQRIVIVDTSAFITSNLAGIQRYGSALDGAVMPIDNICRASIICTFPPGETYFVGQAFSGQATSRQTYVSLVFMYTSKVQYPSV